MGNAGMPINVSCPQCGQKYQTKDSAAGKALQCKKCGAQVSVPMPVDGQGEDGLIGDLTSIADLEAAATALTKQNVAAPVASTTADPTANDPASNRWGPTKPSSRQKKGLSTFALLGIMASISIVVILVAAAIWRSDAKLESGLDEATQQPVSYIHRVVVTSGVFLGTYACSGVFIFLITFAGWHGLKYDSEEVETYRPKWQDAVGYAIGGLPGIVVGGVLTGPGADPEPGSSGGTTRRRDYNARKARSLWHGALVFSFVIPCILILVLACASNFAES